MPQTLIDTFWLEPDSLIVEAKEGQPTLLRGTFQRSDIKNVNGRKYPKRVWEKVLSENSPVSQKIKARGMLGMLDHPKDGKTRMSSVSHVVRELTLESTGEVKGAIEPLPTPKGRTLKGLIEGKVRLGISSRGSGTVMPDGTVADDYVLESFDIVHNPSTKDAFVQPVSEEADKGDERKPMSREQFAIVEQQARMLLSEDITTLRPFQRSEFAQKLLDQTGKLTEAAGTDTALLSLATSLTGQLLEHRDKLLSGNPTEEDDPGDTDPSQVTESEDGEDGEETETEDAPKRPVEDVAQLKALLSEAAKKLRQAHSWRQAALKLIEAIRGKVAGGAGSKLKESAIKLVRAMRESEKEEAVELAVAEAIASNPRIPELKSLLEGCETVEAVQKQVSLAKKIAKGSAGRVTEDADRDDDSMPRSVRIAREMIGEGAGGNPAKKKKSKTINEDEDDNPEATESMFSESERKDINSLPKGDPMRGVLIAEEMFGNRSTL